MKKKRNWEGMMLAAVGGAALLSNPLVGVAFLGASVWSWHEKRAVEKAANGCMANVVNMYPKVFEKIAREQGWK